MTIPPICLAMFASFVILFAANSQRDEETQEYNEEVSKINMHDVYNGQNKPIAGVSGLRIDKCYSDKTTNSLMTVKDWGKNELSLGFLLAGGMAFKDGSLIVPQAGAYHMYSFVNFYVDDQEKCGDSSLVHEIVKHDHIESQAFEILYHDKLPECKENSYYPSRLGGTVMLQKGDSIVIQVSHIYFLEDQSQWHYFGAFLI